MWIVVLIVVAAALGAGGMDKGGETPSSDGEETAEWVDHGIRFVWSPATKELTAYHSETIDGSPGNTVESVGYFPTQEAAYAASLGWMPFSGPSPEGAGGPADPQLQDPIDVPAIAVCQTVKTDGQFSICLYQQTGGKWGFRATDGGGVTVATAGALATKGAALVSAWQMLLPFPTDVVPAPDTKFGVTLMPDGTIGYDATPANRAAWTAKSTAAWQAALNGGETDPAGLVLAVFGTIWPNVNLLRLKPYGQSLGEVAERVAPFKDDAAEAASRIFVAQAGLATSPSQGGDQEPAAPAVQIQLGESAELLQHMKADGTSWWIVTEAGSQLNASQTEMIPWATWGVWGPDTNVSGEPVANGNTALRETAIGNAQVWIETH